MLTRILLDPQGGEGNGGDNANAGTKTGVTADLSTVANGMLQKAGGDAIKVINRLLKENHQGREKLREIQARVPGDGSLVLSGDDLKRYKAYQSLGDDPKAIGDDLTAGRAAIAERDGLVREKLHGEAASLVGLKEGPFRKVAAYEGLNIVVKDELKDGKEVRIPYVVDGNGKETLLSEHVKTSMTESHEYLGFDPKRKAGMPGRANDNTPPPRPGSGSTNDAATQVYMRSFGRVGL